MRETEILVEQQPPQGVFVCDHAGLVINKFSQLAVHGDPVENQNRSEPATSYLRLIDTCITQLKAQGPSRTCHESKEEEEEEEVATPHP